MLTDLCQRWRDRRGTYRPAGEVIATGAYEVARLDDDRTPKAFIEQHHYSGTYPAARFRFGLYRAGALVGVAVFSHPMNDRALACLPGKPIESTELGRLVLLDDVPANGETWFLARCFDELRRAGLVGVISFSDPMARADDRGHVVFRGHIGTIYQAFNGVYLGRGTARTLNLLPNGTVMSHRTIQKIRNRERGWRYGVEQLVAAGAGECGEDSIAYLREWLPRITRKLRHPGNHKYVWALDKRVRRTLPKSLAYPKFDAVAADGARE